MKNNSREIILKNNSRDLFEQQFWLDNKYFLKSEYYMFVMPPTSSIPLIDYSII